MQVPGDGSSSAYGGIIAENDNTSDYSSFEVYEDNANVNSTGIIRMAGDSFLVQNYARTSEYALPITSTPSATLNDTTVMAWRGTGSGTTPIFMPKPVVDSTRLVQDSILVYYQNGSEVGRDTIS